MNLSSEEKEKKQQRAAIEKKYAGRITIAKDGRSYFMEKNYVNAAQRYHEYLLTLSEFKELPDIFSLKPSHFDSEKDVTEMLLISNIFWELARIYDLTPKLQDTFQKCLNQFVRFSVNQPFQVLNSEMLRKFIKNNRNKIQQVKKMKEAYEKIQSDSKGCFIASECFGSNHQTTNQLRSFKPILQESFLGKVFVKYYYRYSFKLINHKYFSTLRPFIVTPLKPLLSSVGRHLEKRLTGKK
jgi:hypothetical protein